MSRIGNAAVVVPNGVDVTIAGLSLTVKGPKGTLSRVFPTGVSIAREENTIVVTRDNEERDSRARHGLVRTLVNNMMIGVTEGYTKELDIIGVGYRAEAQGPSKLKLALGFSHPVVIDAPEGVTFEVPAQTKSSSRVPTKKLLVKLQRTFAKFASQSLTRARVCVTSMKRSCVKQARPARSNREI
jgi:large subunit ribosomal protein L6